jgi:hypothetical protein
MQGYLAHKKQPPPQDYRRALGIVLLYGLRGALFVMSEVPLHRMGGKSESERDASSLLLRPYRSN